MLTFRTLCSTVYVALPVPEQLPYSGDATAGVVHVHSHAIEGGIGMNQLVRAMPGFHVERTWTCQHEMCILDSHLYLLHIILKHLAVTPLHRDQGQLSPIYHLCWNAHAPHLYIVELCLLSVLIG